MQKEIDTPNTDEFISSLANIMPAFFTRKAACKFIDWLYTPKYLANLDARGLGPEKKVYIGKKACYEKHEFIKWLSSNMKQHMAK